MGNDGSAQKAVLRTRIESAVQQLSHSVSPLDFTSFHSIFPIIGEGIYKAREEGSEMWEAVEVQEDEDTLVEVPLDQVVILPSKWLCFLFFRITDCVFFLCPQFLSSVSKLLWG